MRWIAVLPVISMLALPLAARAQDQAPPQPPMAGDNGAAGQYQPGTLPPEPPVIEPPLPGQAPDSQADNMPPPPGPDGGQPPPPMGYGPPGAAGPDGGAGRGPDAGMMRKLETRFDAANTTHDGRLTLQQAEAANMRAIVAHFGEIDTHHAGYVTLNEVMAWRLDQMAQQLKRRAAALRAQPGA